MTDLDGRLRRVADGGAPDTGNGTTPFVDLGAYESVGDCNGNGIPDETEPDGDADGAIDGCDLCPANPEKSLPGACGCDAPESDQDNDAVPDCVDGCPADPDKTTDIDADGDEIPECIDNCPGIPNADQSNQDQDNHGDICDLCPQFDDRLDLDVDGVPDGCDQCPANIRGMPVDDSGCPPRATGDLDRDGDIDGTDATFFRSCISGSGVPYASGCERADLDEDSDSDQSDFGILQRCLSAPGTWAPPECLYGD
ncbi:MAG: hypothetical protein AMXMBFR13_49760 [Phycisphaerae bacterium]